MLANKLRLWSSQSALRSQTRRAHNGKNMDTEWRFWPKTHSPLPGFGVQFVPIPEGRFGSAAMVIQVSPELTAWSENKPTTGYWTFPCVIDARWVSGGVEMHWDELNSTPVPRIAPHNLDNSTTARLFNGNNRRRPEDLRPTDNGSYRPIRLGADWLAATILNLNNDPATQGFNTLADVLFSASLGDGSVAYFSKHNNTESVNRAYYIGSDPYIRDILRSESVLSTFFVDLLSRVSSVGQEKLAPGIIDHQLGMPPGSQDVPDFSKQITPRNLEKSQRRRTQFPKPLKAPTGSNFYELFFNVAVPGESSLHGSISTANLP